MDFYLQKDDKEKISRVSRQVGKTARQLNSLLDNLLNWALIQTGVIPFHPEILPLHKQVEEAVGLLSASAANKGVHIQHQIDPDFKIIADASGFNTIIRNLLSNAIKFSNKSDVIEIFASKKNQWAEITVKDSGIGMEKNIIDQLFSLEKKSKKGTSGEKGTGLGLVLCKELIELHKGHLSIESEVGVGSMFSFTIPIG